ncbi:hypothetical protein HCH_06806 [Hahella chejuensis KCTC 2396]|uniref:Uncharacterized protein n=1 Tax=Hahella chejuensis (strain KCTC 2396) TaxID=349521 RepID=Q2S7E3_HAHCH|nr:hypothetical protein [Hahella chejuensis]ABC33431.1 hypothetical protein HCH_06806 [Hahella chejuensis KCTC 2396]
MARAIKAFNALLGILFILPTTAFYVMGVSLVIENSISDARLPPLGSVVLLAVAFVALLSLIWLWVRHSDYVLKDIQIGVWLGLIAGNGLFIHVVSDPGPLGVYAMTNRLMVGDFKALLWFWLVGGGPALFSWYLLYRVYRQSSRSPSRENAADPSQ